MCLKFEKYKKKIIALVGAGVEIESVFSALFFKNKKNVLCFFLVFPPEYFTEEGFLFPVIFLYIFFPIILISIIRKIYIHYKKIRSNLRVWFSKGEYLKIIFWFLIILPVGTF